MISVVVYGRNDSHGYNLHKRAAISLNAIAEVLDADGDEILFVDYNTPDDLPTFPEAIADTLTARARSRMRVLRVRPAQHRPFAPRTHLVALEPVARNVAIRRSNPANRWILSTNTDMIFTPLRGETLSAIVGGLPDGFYHLPRYELPESLWEGFDRREPEAIIEQTSKWSVRLHLEEIVRGSDDILFDGPGDFQLALRDDLYSIGAFHEEMILGWHVDANLSRRMRLLRGRIDSCVGRIKAYHCDHTRQATVLHRHDHVQNDPVRFVEQIVDPTLPEQSAWGLAGQDVEEVDLTEGVSVGWLRALDAALPPAPDAPYQARYVAETYDDLSYEPAHILPYVMDLLAPAPANSIIAYAGVRVDTFLLVTACAEALERGLQIVTPPGFDWLDCRHQATSIAAWGNEPTVFMIEFGIERGAAIDDRLSKVLHVFDWLTRSRPKGEPARVVAINAIHNRFDRFITRAINPTPTPFSTRVRHGYVGLSQAEDLQGVPGLRAVAEWLTLVSGRTLIVPPDELQGLLGDLRKLVAEPTEKSAVWWKAQRAAGDLIALATMPGLAKQLGCTDTELADVSGRLQRGRFSTNAGGATDPLPIVEGALPEESRLANVQDWEDPKFRRWIDRFFGGDAGYPMAGRSPQVWQRAAILRALEGGLTTDPAPSVLLVAPSDEPLERILTELGMQVNRVSSADQISGKVDAVIFAGRALLSEGLSAAVDKLARANQGLGVGGVLIFLAATRLDDGVDDRSFARELLLGDRLNTAFRTNLGYEALAGSAFALSKATLDRTSRGEFAPGCFVEARGEALTTVSLWSWRKIRDAKWGADQTAGLFQSQPLAGELPLLPNYSPMEIGASLSILEYLRHHPGVEPGGGSLRIRSTTPRGHAIWGPYLTLLSGRYGCAIKLDARRRRLDVRPMLVLEVVLGHDTVLKRDLRGRDLSEGTIDLDFDVEPARVGQEFQVRFTSSGGVEATVGAVVLSRLG